MTASWPAGATRRTDLPIAEGELDEDLTRLVRRMTVIRQGFYFVVLLVALAGQVSGAVEALGIPLAAAIPAVAALELGGVVVLANADVRRRLGERAYASRLLSASIAAAAVIFNWLAHANHLLGGFFAGMSALGYLVWLMHTENQRRDRLRVKGDLPPTTPAYEVAGHWVRHPWLTLRARAMAKANPRLGLYESLAVARAEIRRERRQAAIAKVLHRKIRSAVDPRTADIAIAVYDLDEIAARLAERADYDGLTALIAADLAPERLAPNAAPRRVVDARRVNGTANGSFNHAVQQAVAAEATRQAELSRQADATRRAELSRQADTTRQADASRRADVAREADGSRVPVDAADRRGPATPAPVMLSAAVRQDIERRLGTSRPPAQRSATPDAELITENGWGEANHHDVSLRRRVHAALDATVLPGDQRDDAELIGLVFDELHLSDLERLSAASYVRSWRLETESGQRIRAL